MARVVRSITIDAPVEKVFGFFNAPANLLEVSDVQRLPSGGNSHRFAYKMAGMRFEGTSEDTEYVANQRTVTETKSGIESRITLTSRPADGGTEVTYDEEYTLPIPVLGRLAEAVVVRQEAREVELMLANVKDQLEACDAPETGR